MAQKTEQISGAFLKGLITESNDLTYPPDASIDELNCDINKKGWRERRPGVDYVVGATTFVSLPQSTDGNRARSSFTWLSVAGDGSLNFEVFQNGNTIYFYDHDSANPAVKSFTISLLSYDTETNVNMEPVQFAANKGYLFVAGEKIDPFYVTYNPSGDTITVTPLSIKIRDLDGVDEGTAADFRPTSLSANHNYNLFNQGWGAEDIKHEGDATLRTPLEHWTIQNNTATEGYPSNADLWWSFQSSTKPGVINVDLQTDRTNYYVGNTPAPRGHYLVNPFNMARSTVSGIASVTSPPSTTKRPKAIAAFAGRIWYGGVKASGLSNTLYFSQLIKSDDVRTAADCYQLNDPTAEELNQLLDTDGGVIDISSAGVIQALVPVEAGLLVMADNGIWIVSGPDGVFKPGDFSVKKLSGTGIENFKSVVLVEGTPYWWDKTGIKTLTKDASGLNLLVTNVSDANIKSFYDAIPPFAKRRCKGAYDPFSQKIIWLYNDDEDKDIYIKGLMLDLRFQSFHPYEFKGATWGKVIDLTAIPVLTENNNNTDLRDRFRVLVYRPNGADFDIRLAEFSDETNWKDFASVTGEAFTSYLETGPLTNQEFIRRKAAPIAFTMFNIVANSSCFLSTKWDYAIAEGSNKFGTQFQAVANKPVTFSQVISRHRIRGFGKSVRLRFEAEAGKNFQLTGWALQYLVDNKY